MGFSWSSEQTKNCDGSYMESVKDVEQWLEVTQPGCFMEEGGPEEVQRRQDRDRTSLSFFFPKLQAESRRKVWMGWADPATAEVKNIRLLVSS